MKRNCILSCGIVFIIAFLSHAQRKDLKGQLIANGDVEGIHILNKTALQYAISIEDGSFNIPVKILDTLVVSGIKYKTKMLVITKSIYNAVHLNVDLIEKINQLNEIRIGKILTGSLESDLENSDAKPEINFYDLGIPGYIGKRLTQNERKLHDADGANARGGVTVNFHKLLNGISGRTKTLKKIVALDHKKKCIDRLRTAYESAIFENNTLADSLKNEYFYFCDEDPMFKTICNSNNDLKAIAFLMQKLKAYKNRIERQKKKGSILK